MPSGPGAVLTWLLGLTSVAFLTSLTPVGDSLGLVDDALGTLQPWTAAGLCWLTAHRLRRAEVVLVAGALTCYAIGSAFVMGSLLSSGQVAFPSPADVAYLLFYPLLLAALVVLVRRQGRGTVSAVWFDTALGSLGAAAVLAVVLGPVLASALGRDRLWGTAVAVAYPLFDLLLVAAAVGIVALKVVRTGPRWFLLVIGLLVFTATDVVCALQQTAGTYQVGSLVDGGWVVGLALIALWVTGLPPFPAAVPGADPGLALTGPLAVPAVAAVAALGVLVLGARWSVSPLAVALATATLAAAVARTQLAFRQVVRMGDLRRQATTDDLTGLSNRRALYADLQALIDRPPPRRGALLLLDLDRFQEVIDSLGHQVGDELLIQVGVRVRTALPAGHLVSRFGADEFAVLLDDVDRDGAVAAVAAIRATLTAPFTLGGIALQCGASIGVALVEGAGDDRVSVLRKADIAMSKAKSARTGHWVFALADETTGVARLRTLAELRIALAGNQLVLHYQPKIELRTGAVSGVEALVRWNHPTRGLLYPDAFLDLVEEAGLMRSLTRCVLEQALDQAASWQARGRSLTVAVNLSASSLVDDELPLQVASMLGTRGLPSRALQLEITEESLMADRVRASSILDRLRRAGVQIAVDDFGTGYSSLSYLRDLPIDELKLDRSFVMPMADDARAAALVASVIALAHGLGLRMVAEGVEDDIAYAELVRQGCDEAQGYVISRPVPAADLDRWLVARDETYPNGDRPLEGATPVGRTDR